MPLLCALVYVPTYAIVAPAGASAARKGGHSTAIKTAASRAENILTLRSVFITNPPSLANMLAFSMKYFELNGGRAGKTATEAAPLAHKRHSLDLIERLGGRP